MTSRRESRFRPPSRRAVAMAISLIVLLVVGLTAGLALQGILRSHRQIRDEEQRVQAELLADAALSRAIATLHENPDWKGEVWAATVGSEPEAPGEAIIRVEPAADPAAVQISVEAIYPVDPVQRAKATRQFNYIDPQQGDNP